MHLEPGYTCMRTIFNQPTRWMYLHDALHRESLVRRHAQVDGEKRWCMFVPVSLSAGRYENSSLNCVLVLKLGATKSNYSAVVS
jgi:hypothetical protein